MIRRVDGAGAPGASRGQTTAAAGAFGDAFREAIRLSQHAQRRVQSRGVVLTPEQQERLVAAVEAAREKGSRNAVVLVDRCAFMVSVPERTVVTVLPADRLRVFTHIDGAVIA